MIDKLRSAWNLPMREKTWLLPLLLLSAAARAALLLAPFRLVAPRLGKPHGNIPLSPLATEGQLRTARRIGALAESIGRCTPWQSKCLVQAIMEKALLRHYRIPYVVYLGVAKPHPQGSRKPDGTGPGLVAHAWIVVGPKVVCGAAGCSAYRVVSAFVSPMLLDRHGRNAGGRPAAAGIRRPVALAAHP